MVVFCCNGQGVEEDEEHHQPVKAPGFHIHQTLHPEEPVPATGQATKCKNNAGLLCQATMHQHLHIYKTADLLVVDDLTLAFHLIQAVCVRISTGQRQESWKENNSCNSTASLYRMGAEVVYSADLCPLCRHQGLQHEWSTPCSHEGLHPAADALVTSGTLHATWPSLALW